MAKLSAGDVLFLLACASSVIAVAAAGPCSIATLSPASGPSGGGTLVNLTGWVSSAGSAGAAALMV